MQEEMCNVDLDLTSSLHQPSCLSKTKPQTKQDASFTILPPPVCGRIPTVDASVGQDGASVGLVVELPAGVAGDPVAAASGQGQHGLVCAFGPGQLLEDGTLLLLLRYLVQALIGDARQSLLLL